MKWIWTLFVAAGLALLPEGLHAEGKASANLDLARQLNQAFVQVAEDVAPSVVVITVIEKPYSSLHTESDESDGQDDPFNGLPPNLRKYFRQWEQDHQPSPEERQTGQGSGIIIRKDGYILTNRHVVEDAEKIEVRLKDGRSFKATVRGVDAPSDVAVIKIDAKDLPVAKLADSSKTRVGEFAIAIGAPYALEYSVTFGHVSAKNRSNIMDASPSGMTDQSFIQTDANINPGNSGGPLVNIDGEVIGINTLIRGLHTGIGFAIPINLAREVADQIIDSGKFARSWLGIQIETLSDAPNYHRLLPEVKDGVIVRKIIANGPAAKSDLEAGDVVTAVDGKPVMTSQELKDEVRGKKAGQNVILAVSRITNENGKTQSKQLKITVKPGEWSDNPTEMAKAENDSANAGNGGDLGMTVKALTKDLADKLGVEMTQGVVVSSVDKNGLAAKADIKPGDIITKVNRRAVTNLKQFRDATKNVDTKTGVVINVISEGTARFEILKEEEK
jgi:serine protease Do